MKPLIETLARLQKIRDKSVQDIRGQLVKQRQISRGYDNNIRSLGYLLQKTALDGDTSPSAESLKNIAGYKGNLRRVMAWQQQEKALAKIKEDRIQKTLVQVACQEKIVAMALEDKREQLHREMDASQQKVLDGVAIQCWLRKKTLS